MNRFYLRCAVVWLVSIGASCTSAPVRYYTLTSPPENTRRASETAVDVRVVHIPPQLKRPELMVRTGPTEVTLLDNERWAAPVSDEIKDALRLALARRLDRMTGSSSATAKLTLDLDVQRLEAEFGRHASLEASWSATLTDTSEQSKGARATSCTFQADEKIRAGYAEVVDGYQRAIAALADAIVSVLTNPASANDSLCQKSLEDSTGGSESKDH